MISQSFLTVLDRFSKEIFANKGKSVIFVLLKQGALAERLGTGLQNLLQRFDSARHLTEMSLTHVRDILRFKSFLHLSYIL